MQPASLGAPRRFRPIRPSTGEVRMSRSACRRVCTEGHVLPLAACFDLDAPFSGRDSGLAALPDRPRAGT
jgi:hypothetical protein